MSILVSEPRHVPKRATDAKNGEDYTYWPGSFRPGNKLRETCDGDAGLLPCLSHTFRMLIVIRLPITMGIMNPNPLKAFTLSSYTSFVITKNANVNEGNAPNPRYIRWHLSYKQSLCFKSQVSQVLMKNMSTYRIR